MKKGLTYLLTAAGLAIGLAGCNYCTKEKIPAEPAQERVDKLVQDASIEQKEPVPATDASYAREDYVKAFPDRHFLVDSMTWPEESIKSWREMNRLQWKYDRMINAADEAYLSWKTNPNEATAGECIRAGLEILRGEVPYLLRSAPKHLSYIKECARQSGMELPPKVQELEEKLKKEKLEEDTKTGRKQTPLKCGEGEFLDYREDGTPVCLLKFPFEIMGDSYQQENKEVKPK